LNFLFILLLLQYRKSIWLFSLQTSSCHCFIFYSGIIFIISCNNENPNPKDLAIELNIDGYWSGAYKRSQLYDTTSRPIGVLFKENDRAVYYNLSPTLDTLDAINKYSIKYLIRNDSLFMNVDEVSYITQYFGSIDSVNHQISRFFSRFDLSGGIPVTPSTNSGTFHLHKE
jgi:hypothetical protein